jgi:hypothetical protein
MLTYALGRGLQYYDQCALESIVQRMEQHDYPFFVPGFGNCH